MSWTEKGNWDSSFGIAIDYGLNHQGISSIPGRTKEEEIIGGGGLHEQRRLVLKR
jgi:hypothetical protein